MTLARSDVPFIEAGPDSCGLCKEVLACPEYVERLYD